jgi:hypothetical protein
MLRVLLVILVVLLPCMAFGQDVVKVNILEMAGTIPAPPRDVNDAYSRTAAEQGEGDVTVHRTPEAFYKPVKDKLEATKKQIEKAVQVNSKPEMDVAKEMDQKEMQKKFESMSQEERIKMAMDLAKKMGMTATMARESDAVIAAQEECKKINLDIGNDLQTAQAAYEARAKLVNDRDTKHKQIDSWQEEEVKKLPQVSTGEMGGPEPKAEYALLTKAMQKHLAVENDYLKAVQKEWKATWDKYHARFAPLQEKLAKIQYGADAKNRQTRRELLTGQGMMVSSTGDLVELSRKATEGAAEWWERKLGLEKSKPKD